jgi:uncharacterized protein YcaQ
METVTPEQARRLALLRAGLLDPASTGLPRRAGRSPRRAAHAIVERFGYLQLDTVAVSGARSHALVLLSRLDDLAPALPEDLLQPGEPLFEYWGHEACWMPLRLYPHFAFRRAAYREHPWWRDIIEPNRAEADALLARIAEHGPVRSAELEGEADGGWWGWKASKKIAAALWRSGELAIRERRGFQRSYDLAERVIPGALRDRPLDEADALPELLLLALGGHGWAAESTLRATWRLTGRGPALRAALRRLRDAGEIEPCALVDGAARRPGWIRRADLEGLDRLARMRPRTDRPVLLSPFDPVLWDRGRVQDLFGFEQLLEIFKPKATRRWGYYCLPVLAGDRLVGRADLKADRRRGALTVLAWHPEPGRRPAAVREAGRRALERQARVLGLVLEGFE